MTNTLNIKAISLKKINSMFEMKQDFIYRDIAKFSTGNIALIGMRRLGKTEYLKFRIHAFIKKEMLRLGASFKLDEALDKIIALNFDDTYFSFIDFSRIESENFYQITLQINEAIEKGVKLIVIDEIQRRVNWTRWIKGFVDQYPDVEFVVTGSDATLMMNSGELGGGRFEIKYIGPLMFSEWKNMKLSNDTEFTSYFDNWVFPDKEINENFTLQKLQTIEKQLLETNISRDNVENVLRVIALNPGTSFTGSSLKKALDQDNDTKIGSAKQVNDILEFLIESQLILRIENEYTRNRSSEANSFKYYPVNWNLYKYYAINNSYTDLLKNDNSLPRAGLVFENAIIANIWTSFTDLLEKSWLTYYADKTKNIDFDLKIWDHYIEIKSYDIFNQQISDEENEKLIRKMKKFENTIILHTGKTGNLDGIKVINIVEFLEKQLWKSWQKNH